MRKRDIFACMTIPTGKPVGRPIAGKKRMDKTLGGVFVSKDMLDDYSHVAELEGISRSEWIRNTLNRAAARLKNKHHSNTRDS